MADSIAVHVDPTVELISTIYRLAGVSPFDSRFLPSYTDDIEEWFAPYRDHQAIEVVRDLGQNHGINGSAPMALAVYLNAPELEGKVSLSPLPQDLDPRWTPETVSVFRDAVRAFSADTRFMEFYASRSGYFDRSVKSLLSSLEGHPIIPWLQDFFGQGSERYVIVVGMQIGNGNYGISTTLDDGSREFISIIGANSPSPFRKIPRFSAWWFVPWRSHHLLPAHGWRAC